ncbi:cysteine three histidine 1 [Paramormyrops kingsleyae]|uniref:mRNA decay activator protein ZFP36 n=1 Tax=Paramormyrops kingsleyae TaxID=1676925 RepID=A0A3B3T6B9_9TELE|nr:mRNA decay activator protein ZFP36L2-like [Paramormyrops kingsleyae]
MSEEESIADLLLTPYPEDEDSEESLFPVEPLHWSGLSLAEALLPLVESPMSSHVPQSPWLCSTRYKTELCSRYAETGSCKYAERCQFAHGLHDLRVPSRHPKYKTELCHAFHTVGYCAYGARCLFVHGPEEQRQVRPRRRNIPCRTFRSFGVCPFGARCNFLHVDVGDEDENGKHKGGHQPGTLCRTFSSFGFCLYGTRCRFQHRVPAANSAGGPDCSLGVSCAQQLAGRALSLASDLLSSSDSSSSPPQSALTSPVYLDDSCTLTPPIASSVPLGHNAFTFSSQHLSDLLLPLAWRLKQLESTPAKVNSSPGVEGKSI